MPYFVSCFTPVKGMVIIMQSGVLPALAMSLIAGLSTCIGSFIAIFAKRTDTKMLSFALGFSAGVMILVSFADLLPEARMSLSQAAGPKLGGAAAALSLIGGLAAAVLLDKLVPSFENGTLASGAGPDKTAALKRMGLVTALALTLHNFPEGIATFMAGYSNFRIGLPITLSISMHNIPEGIAVSIPVLYGTGSRPKAFFASALSGLSEPLGAILAFLILAPFLNESVLGAIFGAVAGIMIYLSFDELIPTSERYGRQRLTLCGVFAGAAVMLLALGFFNF